jgi:hypothetical protein
MCDGPSAVLPCQVPGTEIGMDPSAGPQHPVLRHLALLSAARDFGLSSNQLDPLVLRFAGSFEQLADAVTGALLARS